MKNFVHIGYFVLLMLNDSVISSAMKGRHKENVVSLLDLVLLFSFQLPVGLIDQH